MLSEVAGSKMIPFGVSTSSNTSNNSGGGGATSLSQSGYRRIEPMPIKSLAQPNRTEMPPPRNPGTDSNSSVVVAGKVQVQELNQFFVCFLCKGYKIEATTINECMHSCECHFLFVSIVLLLLLPNRPPIELMTDNCLSIRMPRPQSAGAVS